MAVFIISKSSGTDRLMWSLPLAEALLVTGFNAWHADSGRLLTGLGGPAVIYADLDKILKIEKANNELIKNLETTE